MFMRAMRANVRAAYFEVRRAVSAAFGYVLARGGARLLTRAGDLIKYR